jgi:ABC-type transporter lipoprotein component MlaA/pimeloyl-ACP methyl ester carboxylesterase
MVGLLAACSITAPRSGELSPTAHQVRVDTPVPDFMPDPYEKVNRVTWAVNKGLLIGVMQPAGRVYRAVVPKPVRGSIVKFTRNVTYPGRALNNILQGRWSGARDETLRFLTNTTAGGLGFFDVATTWNMPKSDADFSQTFGKWGWQPHTYIVLPAIGPSDERHTTGYVLDEFAEPWNYAFPYRYASYVSVANEYSDKTEGARRLIETEPDSYELVRYAWTYQSKDTSPNWALNGSINKPMLETLGAVKTTYKDPEFINNGKELSVSIPSTGRNLRFNCWIHSATSPLVYISPGFSSNRLSQVSLSLAEYLYGQGYSVVTTTSVFHPDFMNNASTVALPAYPPVDSHDMLVALTEMDRRLEKKYPGKFGKRALVGCSMGGYLTTRIAAYEKQISSELLHFDRYVTIDAPVNLVGSARKLDALQDAPLEWPVAVRQERIDNTVHKAAASGVLTSTSKSPPPFSEIESKYLIGLSFRVSLRDVIYASQSRENMGILQVPINQWYRKQSYHEIMNYSFKDYFVKFVVPYYQKRGVSLNQLLKEGDLRNYAPKIRNQSKLRVIINKDDILLPVNDLAWYRSTIPTSHLTIFPNGGHLGNLGDPLVQAAVLKSLSDLK